MKMENVYAVNVYAVNVNAVNSLLLYCGNKMWKMFVCASVSFSLCFNASSNPRHVFMKSCMYEISPKAES